MQAELGCASVALGRALRACGIPTVVDDELAFCRAVVELDPRDRAQVYWAARACFLRRPEGLEAFEAVFDRFWAGLALELGEPIAEHGETDARLPGPQHGGESLPSYRLDARSSSVVDGNGARARQDLEVPTAAGDRPGDGAKRGVLSAYSPTEVLTERELLDWSTDELAALRRLARELRASIPERRSRRHRPTRRRERLDVRRTLRASLRTDGELLGLRWTARRTAPRRLLLLCDVSGSMERYSRALLGSLHAAVGASSKTEAFVFATRLTRLTPALCGRDAESSLDRARDAVSDWSGGTRIGSALEDLRRRYGGLGLARGAIVVVVSDGWDRGDPQLLARELARLRLQARRLVWVNPRPSELDGQPLATGMRVALPYVDDFVPGHDPRAVAGLAGVLARLGDTRPPRRQRLGFEAR